MAIIVATIAVTRGWQTENSALRTNLIESDGIGYYMHLPSIFISHNLSDQEVDNRYIFEHNGRAVNKYYAGTALLMSPFFFGATLINSLNNQPLSPYSGGFQLAIAIAGLFYFFIGVYALFQLMRAMLLSEKSIFISLFAVVFGTNLLVYAVYHPSFSHVYSFACNSLFLLFTYKLLKKPNNRMLILAFAVLGLSLVIRPINILIVLIVPFLGVKKEELQHFVKYMFSHYRWLLIGMVLLCIVLPQLIIWKIQSGSWLLNGYKNEGFYFMNPQISNFLFSFRKGLFIYTPILILCILGALMFAQTRIQKIFFALFILSFFYLSAAWWNWYYGPSFGQRVVVDFMSVMALGLAFLIQRMNKLKHLVITISVLVVLTIVNLIQSYQYTQNILCSWNMNFDKYKYVFLSTNQSKRGVFGGQNDIAPYGEWIHPISSIEEDFDIIHMTERESNYTSQAKNMSGQEFSAAWELPAPPEWIDGRTHYAEIELSVFEEYINACKEAYLVFEIQSKSNNPYFYRAIRLMDVPDGEAQQWISRNYSIETDVMKSREDTIRVYLWNKEKADFLLDDFRLTLFNIQ